MADTTALKNRIRAAIKANDNQEITGPVLQQTLLDIVDELDLNPELQNLQRAIDSEAQTRQSADTLLNNLITGIKNNIDNGYVYAGVAMPSTVPVSGKVFYVAIQAGTYINFGNTAVTHDGINILKYNGSVWSNDVVIAIDDEPTIGSDNPVKSGGVANSLGKEKNNITTSEIYDGYVTPSGYEDTTTTWVHRYVFNISNKPLSNYKITTDVSNDIIAVCSVKDIRYNILVVSQASSISNVFEFSTETYPDAAYIVVSSMGTLNVEQTTFGNFAELDKKITDNKNLSVSNSNNIEKIISSQTPLQEYSTEVGYYTPNGYHAEDSAFTTNIYDVSNVNDVVIAKTTASNGIIINALVKDDNNQIILLGDVSSVKKYFCFSKKEYPTAKYLLVSNSSTAWAVNDGVLGDIYKEITKNKDKVQYNILNNLKGKSITWFGTSIPAGWENGTGYPNRMGALLGATIYNEAVGGSCANGKLEDNYTMSFPVIILSLGHNLYEKRLIINSCWNIDDTNRTVSPGQNSLGITDIPQNVSYEEAIDYRWRAFSMSYMIRLMSWHCIPDGSDKETFLKSQLGNELYNQIVNVENRDISYKETDVFVFDHGNNDYAAGSYPYDSNDITVFPGAINFFISMIMRWQPRKKIVLISNYRDIPQGVNTTIENIAKSWGCPFIDVSSLLPFKTFKKLYTRGYWDSSKVWHDSGFEWSENDNSYTTNLYLEGMDYNRVRGDLSLSQVKERINPLQIEGVWMWYANPIDIWLYDGLHPHQNGNKSVINWYANTLAIEFLNKVKTF